MMCHAIEDTENIGGDVLRNSYIVFHCR